MDFGFSEENELLRTTAREFLASESPMAVVREIAENEPRGYRPELWRKMAELGWTGLLIPERYGGAGLGFLDLAVILEEMGRALFPSPFFAHLQGTLALLHAGSEEQRQELLPAAAEGRLILTFCITEESGTEEPGGIATRAQRGEAGYQVSGTKLFVPHAQNAGRLLVAARTGGEGEEGISLLLVDPSLPGVEIVPLESLDPTRRLCEVRFREAAGQLVGGENGGWPTWEWVRDRALVALALEAVGGAAKVLEDAVRHAKERVQFGRPIGVHQAIKHKCADLLIDVEASRALTDYAVWSVAEEAEEAGLAAAMAKAYTSDAYRRASAENIQIHGGVGFTWEYDCHYHFRRAKAIEVTYGDPGYHRERVARLLEL